jgi:hypothetical protein
MRIEQPRIELRSVHSLQQESFFIPSYQRGYRWGATQIEDLLTDIWDYYKFHTNSSTEKAGKYYCLQPLVVKRRPDNAWEILDGQQRITTIYLIMKCLENELKVRKGSLYTISYETRTEVNNSFLLTLDDKNRNDNIDIYHMANAVETIKSWFIKNNVDTMDWLQTLIRKDSPNTQFIWYEIPAHYDSIEIFTRLNLGKIPLTNAELVRALFFRKSHISNVKNDSLQLRIASNWDAIEHQLQRSEFWYFINDRDDIPASRIEFIFDQITQEHLASPVLTKPSWSEDKHRIFHYYNNQFKNRHLDNDSADISYEFKSDLWSNVQKLHMTLDEWFNNRTLYHLIGFILYQGHHKIHELHAQSINMRKSDFKSYLKGIIFKDLFAVKFSDINESDDNVFNNVIKDYIESIEYSDSTRKKLRSLLLLFNIATLELNVRSNIRFPFDNYKIQKWDIEHINAIAEKPNRVEDQRAWFQRIVEFHKKNTQFFIKFTDKDVKKKLSESSHIQKQKLRIKEPGFGFDVENNLKQQISEISDFAEFFDGFYLIVMEIFNSPASDQINKLGNLTLLDEAINRSYQNDPYPLKRDRIMRTDHEGKFVPLCTRNVFLKAYSTELDQMLIWSESDQEAYEQNIIDTLQSFFKDMSFEHIV